MPVNLIDGSGILRHSVSKLKRKKVYRSKDMQRCGECGRKIKPMQAFGLPWFWPECKSLPACLSCFDK